MRCALGVDIGGTKIQFCHIAENLSVTALGQTPTALLRRGTPLFAGDLAELIRSRLPLDADGVAVSLNGVLNGGTVAYSSLMGGKVNFPLAAFLSQALACEVRVDDDIHAMAIAEAHAGAGGDGAPFALLNLGTGIGVGCYAGNVLRGHFAAGLISEQMLYIDELNEYRSLDRTVCGRGIREMYYQLSGQHADAVTLFSRAIGGEDAPAVQTIGLFTRYLGRVMQMISRFYHPERIIINGSIKKAAGYYLDQARAYYHEGLEPAFHAEIMVSPLAHAAELGTFLGGIYPHGKYAGVQKE